MCKEIVDMKQYIRKFSINSSVHSMTRKDIVDKLLNLVGEYSIETSDITIEILEDVCSDKDNTIYENINKLYDYILAALKFLEINIPREFLILEQNFYSLKNKNILAAIIEFCKKIECKVVSEGIETEYDDKLMKNLGVDYIQGYFYSKHLEKIDFILKFNYPL